MTRQRGQAMVEFALVCVLMLVIVLGLIDFSYLFFTRTDAYQATRAAARFAATNPTAWSSSATPAAGSIEAVLKAVPAPLAISNDDAHVTISYLVPGSGGAATCGSWSAAAGAFQAQPGYSQASCVTPGHLVQVKAVYSYPFVTPLLKSTFGSVPITVVASALEET